MHDRRLRKSRFTSYCWAAACLLCGQWVQASSEPFDRSSALAISQAAVGNVLSGQQFYTSDGIRTTIGAVKSRATVQLSLLSTLSFRWSVARIT